MEHSLFLMRHFILHFSMKEYKEKLDYYKQQDMISKYNSFVPEYNSLLGKRKALVTKKKIRYAEYNRLITDINAKVKQYNRDYR